MLGDTAVGKSSLVSQFMTSEYLHAYDTSIGKLTISLCVCFYFVYKNCRLFCCYVNLLFFSEFILELYTLEMGI